MILPVIAIIVGAHSFPLARLFGSAIYYWTAAFGSATGLTGLLIRDANSRRKFVGVMFGVLLWVTTGIVLLVAARLNS